MIRSFHYAAYASVLLSSDIKPKQAKILTPVMQRWYEFISAQFINAYKKSVSGTVVIPASPETFDRLLKSFLLEKAVYELNYELNNRPDWVMIPLNGIQSLMQADMRVRTDR
jgi:maltose alpha-D-glucosyltransferase/alpha-amylase